MSDLPTVWLVEDSRLEAEQALRALSGEYAVELFPDGPSLIERLEGGALPLLLILDQNLPGMTGLEVCQFVRQRRDERELPIIMVTSVAEKASVVAALSSGASDYLTKPYDPEELRARVRTQARIRALNDRAAAAERAREEARAEADRERDRLQALIASAPAGVCLLTGPSHLCDFANPRFLALMGGGELLGHPLGDRQADLGGETLRELLDRIYASGEVHVAQATRQRRTAGPPHDLSDLYLKTTYQPRRDRAGQVVGIDLFTFDVTDQEVGRRKLEELLSLASHELKTPLTSLKLHLQSLVRALGQGGPLSPEKLRQSLEAMDRQMTRQLRLVDDLLDVSRLDPAAVAQQGEVLEVTGLVSEVAARLETERLSSGSPLVLNGAAPVEAVLDRLRLDQVVSNLLSNALKYGRGKPVEITTQSVGRRRLRLTFKDHGIGIASGDLGRVFERFERAVSERHYAGFGLGLWIVRRNVEALGGTISVSSTRGAGSSFVVELPRTPLHDGLLEESSQEQGHP